MTFSKSACISVFLILLQTNAFADPACNDLLSGLPAKIQSSIRDLAKLRYDLDRRLANGENDAVTRNLQSQYLQKEKEVLAAAQLDSKTLIEKIRAEVERVQKDAISEEAQHAERKMREAEAVPRVKQIGTLKIQRSNHKASVLPDGRVVITGGRGPKGKFVHEIEIIDPKTGHSQIIGTLKEERKGYSQTVLLDGQVLIAGGSSGSGNQTVLRKSVEVINPDSNETSIITELADGRDQHAQSLLSDGRVVLTSGFLVWEPTPSVEVIDPKTGSAEIIGDLTEAKWAHAQSTLQDGRILITGGHTKGAQAKLSSVEVFDPTTRKSQVIGNLTEGRAYHQQSVLNDGRVLIVGGSSDAGVTSLVEVFDPKTGKTTPLGYLKGFGVIHDHVITPDSKHLVAIHHNPMNEANEVEIFDLSTGETEVVAHLYKAKMYFTMSLLPSGDILVVGGGSDSIELISTK